MVTPAWLPPLSPPPPDEWTDEGTPLEPEGVNQAMRRLPPDHQAVLSLRYLDDLTVPEVAAALGRSVHRRAFRTSYVELSDGWPVRDWFREPVDAGQLDPAFVARMRELVVEEWQADAGTIPSAETDPDYREGSSHPWARPSTTWRPR